MMSLISILGGSWFFNFTQQLILVGSAIVLGVLYLVAPLQLSIWVFQDFMSVILVFLTLYLLILMKLMTPLSKTLSFLLVILSLDLFLVFTVDNILLFYILFEFSLIPMSLMILGWGFQPERLSATLYMLFYTITASFPFLVILIFLGSPNFSELTLPFSLNPNGVMGVFILLPFLVKLPMFMTHVWLPKAHVEAPSFGSMVLAGVLLKLGSFGIWRLHPLLPPSSLLLAMFSLAGAAICGLFVNMQTDVKAMIAYSSVVHMGLIAFCVVLGSPLAMLAALMMMIAHGICSSGLFCLITIAYERMTSRSVVITQGLLSSLPSLCVFFSILLLMNLSAPPSLNLLSEVSMIYCALSWDFVSLLWMSLLILFSLTYSLVLFYSYYHGAPTPSFSTPSESKKELTTSFFHAKWWALSPFIMFVFEL